ncbi:hypothetical protein J4232_05925 [Candidatus Woesearchaeota archaeon]|nr:hypothetical protein [Candidatus Woesearchaeota archaeon]
MECFASTIFWFYCEEEKAKELIEEYYSEKEKRARFTYELRTVALENKAETSLKKARRFNEEIRKILGR